MPFKAREQKFNEKQKVMTEKLKVKGTSSVAFQSDKLVAVMPENKLSFN